MNALALKLESSFTDLEWKVIETARSDGPRSIKPDGPFTRFLQNFFGLPITRRLASDKLEALRCFCARAWFSDFIRNHDVRAVMDVGYSSTDVLQILAHVALYRGFTPTLEEGAAA